MIFYSPEEVIIAFHEKVVDLHAIVKVKVEDFDENGEIFQTYH